MAQWPQQETDNQFTQKNKEVLLKVGKDEFTYEDLMSWRCPNFMAARRLSNALKSLQPASVKELAERLTVGDLFALDGVGQACVWVWMNALHACEVDVDTWLNTSLKMSTLHQQGKRKQKKNGGRHYNLVVINQKTA